MFVKGGTISLSDDVSDDDDIMQLDGHMDIPDGAQARPSFSIKAQTRPVSKLVKKRSPKKVRLLSLSDVITVDPIQVKATHKARAAMSLN